MSDRGTPNQTYVSRDERFHAELDAAYAEWFGPRDRLILQPLGLEEDQLRAVLSLCRSAFTSGARFTAERVALSRTKANEV